MAASQQFSARGNIHPGHRQKIPQGESGIIKSGLRLEPNKA
jgi:hypothetical protein